MIDAKIIFKIFYALLALSGIVLFVTSGFFAKLLESLVFLVGSASSGFVGTLDPISLAVLTIGVALLVFSLYTIF